MVEFPITYLGLPLSIKKLKSVHFMPLIDALQARVQGWQSKFLSPAGRLTLVKSVLSSLPLHYLQTLKLSNWVCTEIDKIRRSFLWKGTDKCTGGHCLVNWEICTLPKKNGGLGIIRLQSQNDALMLRWLWKLTTEPESIWSKTVQEVYGTKDLPTLSNHSRLSHSMKCLLTLWPILNVSTYHDTSTQTLLWRWTADRLYSSRSAYHAIHQPGCTTTYHSHLWKIKAPHKVRFFLWLSLRNRLLTFDNLHKRGWPAGNSCMLCNSGVMETIDHIFLQCQFTKYVCSLVNPAITPSAVTITLEEHWQRVRTLHPHSIEASWIAMLWNTWKERNAAVFQGAAPNARRVVAKTIQDASLWAVHC